MNTFASILRGINVSGKRMIKMDDLKKLYQELGFEQVQSFIQSGNMVFQTKNASGKELEERIKRAIEERFGHDVSVLVLTQPELEDCIANNPFADEDQYDPAFVHVTFLAEKPDELRCEKIDPMLFLPDTFRIRDRFVYLFCPKGYGNTKLNNGFFEKKLGVDATTRNWKTSQILLNMLKS